VDRAVITHGHADHARAGHGAVAATPETLAIMAERYGEDFAGQRQPWTMADVTHNGVEVTWSRPATCWARPRRWCAGRA
jgi:putative mRNA 3-end processing factor